MPKYGVMCHVTYLVDNNDIVNLAGNIWLPARFKEPSTASTIMLPFIGQGCVLGGASVVDQGSVPGFHAGNQTLG